MNWNEIAPDNLPPLEVPVWLWLRDLGQPIIGCRTQDGCAWYWANCYGAWYYSRSGMWKTTAAETEDFKPTHWQPLPEPPTKGQP
jgi:hypothetical protein